MESSRVLAPGSSINILKACCIHILRNVHSSQFNYRENIFIFHNFYCEKYFIAIKSASIAAGYIENIVPNSIMSFAQPNYFHQLFFLFYHDPVPCPPDKWNTRYKTVRSMQLISSFIFQRITDD